MRGNWIGGAATALLCLVVTGCAAGGATSEDPVPTLSVRSSPTPSASASTESGFTVSAEPSASEKPSPSATKSEKASASPSTATAAPETSEAPPEEPSTVDLGTAPTSYAEATAYVDRARSDGSEQEMRVFRTPEDIYCLMTSDYSRPACELPQGAGIEDQQACRNAMGDRVGRIEVTDQRARAVCNTDTIRETVPQSVEPVGVVTNAKSGLTCAVADIGVTCVQVDHKIGFFLALDSYDVFG